MSQDFNPNPYQVPTQIAGSPGVASNPPSSHSIPGIASFIIALVNGLLFLSIIGYSVYITIGSSGQIDQNSAVLVGLLAISMMALLVIGLCLGAVGLFLGNRKRLFAILGLCLNGLILFGIVGLMVLGSVAQ